MSNGEVLDQGETATSEPTATEVTKIRNVTHVHMGRGLWWALSVCFLCFTAVYILTGMGYVSKDAAQGKRGVQTLAMCQQASDTKGKVE